MKKIPLWKNIVLIFCLIVTIIIATLAWFYNDHRGTVNLNVEVGEASYVQISGDGGNNWSEDLEIGIGVNQNFKEISGDGTTFYEPVYELGENSEGKLAYQIVNFAKVEDTEKFYEQTFEIRSDLSQYIHLAPESFVAAVNDARESNIEGAVRIAFFEVDDNDAEKLIFVWAPNSKTEYMYDSNAFTKEGNVEDYYYFQKSTRPVDVNALVATNNDVAVIHTNGTGASNSCSGCGYDAKHKFLWTCGQDLPENTPALLKIDVPEGADFGYKKIRIRVWLEGHDRECVNLLGRQKFTMNLQFNAERGE